MKDEPKNIPASIHARLTKEAKKRGEPFGEVLQYYGIERFLYRLSKTPYSNSFILKGGLVFYSLEIALRRPTRDIDFLSELENHNEIINYVIRAAISVSVPGDGIRFDPDSIVLHETQADADRKGIRVMFRGYLANAEIPMQVDFGFSDELTSEPEVINYPTLLNDWDNPKLKAYPMEAIVAEKFHTMERFVATASRWKDYYDIWLISSHLELDDQSLEKAIGKTFEKRNTPIPIGRPNSLAVEFGSKHQRDWELFLKKSDLENAQINDLLLLVEKIWAFLAWPLSGLTAPDKRRVRKHWTPATSTWR